MAAAKAVPTVTGSVAGPGYQISGSLAIDVSPATYTTGGIALNFLQALVKASRTPSRVFIEGIAGYTYAYVKGTDASNGKLMIFVQDAVATNPLLEMANALAIAAGLSGDTINFVATFAGME